MQKDELREKAIKGCTRCDGAAVQLGHCPEDCPYFGESERADQCVAKLHADALALLKDQKARVMTFEEAAGNALSFLCTPDSVKPVFVQFKDETYADEGLTPPWRGGVNQRALLMNEPNRYGKDFVFWSDRPSKEQMRAVEWEGKTDD